MAGDAAAELVTCMLRMKASKSFLERAVSRRAASAASSLSSTALLACTANNHVQMR